MSTPGVKAPSVASSSERLHADMPGSPAGLMTKSTSAASLLSTATPSSALYNFRLLSALRSENPSAVQPFIDELSSSPEGLAPDAAAGRLLGMAVRVATVNTLALILASPNVASPNLPVSDKSKATALHVAAEIGRADAVEALLNDPRINDTIQDEQGRTPFEVASNAECSQLIEDSRAALQIKYLALLASYIASPLSSVNESGRITQFLEGPRADILNLNALDQKTGTSLLHEAARRRDQRLVELAVKRGADVFIRDKRGKRVLESDKGADERIKVYLRQFSSQEGAVQARTDGRPPDLKGFLSKWVNYRSGWKTRWVVLENGVLSYYRNREDEGVACRGSIALATAHVHAGHDGTRFEVESRANSSVPKMIMKSSHRAEIARWVQTIRLNMEYYRSAAQIPKSGPNEGVKLVKRQPSLNTKRSKTLKDLPPTDSFLTPRLQRTVTHVSGIAAPPSAAASPLPMMKRPSSPTGTVDTLAEALDATSFVEPDNASIISQAGPEPGLPHEATFELGVLNIKAQLELTAQLIGSIVTPPGTPDPSRPAPQRHDSRQSQVKDALRESLATLAVLVSQQDIMTQDRERYLVGRIQREVEARRLWEENMLAVAQQQEETDRQLSEAAKDNEKKRRALRQARGVLAGLSGASPMVSPAGESVSSAPGAGILEATTALPASTSLNNLAVPRGSISNIQEVHDAIAAAADDESDNEDEFFDAIEMGTLPNLKLHESIANPERPGTPAGTEDKRLEVVPTSAASKGTIKEYLARHSLEPYKHVRNKLPINDDKRPSVSLWSILKSSVGKDLTKISFPVSFNECTSMLQRMAEDMEYDACLTVAASEQDSLKRIAFVGAFAMSNYSSTIGRIAKPFNPLLSQSFEYAIPNRYRYISEQVSHHPPISACYCEAPTWKYYGEVDAQNKFQGRSFEIRPTGVAHAELAIPKSWVKPGLTYPDAGPEYGAGYVTEHYSWKKVTTNVSNFIMGSPIIDHYGDLVVTNHRTGETCTLTFKPRGWRGKDAFEIKGNVVDAQGNTAWDIAGRWDSQLVARQSGSSVPLEVDTEVKPSQKEYLLLWRNSEKPKAPFNLTPFAVTLNDIPQGLQNYLCPTDCRLRTDQRAFENAEYDKAQMLKTANEEKQRETRKQRADGRLPPHEPRWFTASTDGDSGERLWQPKRDAETGEVRFWKMREDAQASWNDIDHIFVEDE
ncbi:hypothetical protein Q5752_006776 [Cryptotrichosporon argae]